MPLNGLRWSRNSGSANCDMPQSAVFGRPGGGKRSPEVDVAKGIGIVLVVLAHCCGGTLPSNVINSFHMPLFFCLSGLFLFRKNESFRDFINKKAKSLLFPCLIFGILLSTYSTTLDYVRGESEIPLGLRYVGLFINTRHNPYPGSLWFFLALFLVELMLYFIHNNSSLKISQA